MAKRQRVDITGCGYGKEKMIETSRVSVEEAITAYSEDELEMRYYIGTDSNGCEHLCKLNVDVDYNEGGEREFLQRKLG